MLDSIYILNYTGSQINAKLEDEIKKYLISLTTPWASSGFSSNDTLTVTLTIQGIITEVST